MAKFLMLMRRNWWKVVSVILLFYVLAAGLLAPVPAREILNETIRNLYFHVPMWFTMIVLFALSAYRAVVYLRSGDIKDDIASATLASTGIFFSILGMLTGMEWAQYTWGAAWSNDPKQLGTALCMLTYFAYWVLRSGIKDEDKRAKVSAVYNIFIFALMIPLIFILPRMVDSLHPGNGGNPAFSNYDLDSRMRLVFYPAVLGWILFGVWLASLLRRVLLLQHRHNEQEFDYRN
ncbi:MAG TPA: cytochrome c biogenesis protein CcsA [Chitinophagaceae bacterium]|nr:cytochrome c biogenesis protein CcsA [Chitinophagaceae bacterium]